MATLVISFLTNPGEDTVAGDTDTQKVSEFVVLKITLTSFAVSILRYRLNWSVTVLITVDWKNDIKDWRRKNGKSDNIHPDCKLSKKRSRILETFP